MTILKDKRLAIILTFALILAMLAGCSPAGSENTNSSSPPTVESGNADAGSKENIKGGADFSSLEALDFSGNEVNSDIFDGKALTMINIWGTFCGPCIREMPDLGKLNSEYADKGFQVVGVVADIKGDDAASLENAKEIVEDTGADYIHLLPSQSLFDIVLKDTFVIPRTLFVDENGNQVGDVVEGARSLEAWKEIVDGLLEQLS